MQHEGYGSRQRHGKARVCTLGRLSQEGLAKQALGRKVCKPSGCRGGAKRMRRQHPGSSRRTPPFYSLVRRRHKGKVTWEDRAQPSGRGRVYRAGLAELGWRQALSL